MLRAIIIWLSRAKWAQRIITNWGLARRVSSRFVAGETLAEAVDAVRQLNQNGIFASLDILGESTTNAQEAGQAASQIQEIIKAIQAANIQANISLKLSQIGMALDADLCRRYIEEVLEAARQADIFVRLDMEESTYTNLTLEIYRDMRSRGFENVGVVIQAYLYRSRADLEDLCSLQTRVRLCKGAYQEPARLAFPRKQDVDASYDALADYLLEQARNTGIQGSPDGRFPPLPAIATHDPARINHVKAWLAENPLPAGAVEFQMLYGIRRDLQADLVKAGHRVRVYVPFGTHWYPYLMRRLAERPANLWFFTSNLFRS